MRLSLVDIAGRVFVIFVRETLVYVSLAMHAVIVRVFVWYLEAGIISILLHTAITVTGIGNIVGREKL